MNKKNWYVLCSIMLGVAILPIMPYGYYEFLRLVICGVSLWQICVQYKKNNVFPVVLCLIALLYNPVFSVHLSREIWTVLNVLTLVYFLLNKTER